MDFESYQEDEYIDRQVDEIFEDVSDKTIEERMAIATFDLLEHIDEERSANQDLLRAWLESGRDRKGRPLRPGFITAIGAGFAGMGFAPADDSAEPLPNAEQKPKPTEKEITLKENRLEKARHALQNIRTLISDVYGLNVKQMKKAEADARNLKLPNNL